MLKINSTGVLFHIILYRSSADTIICEGLELSKSKLVVIILLALLMLSVVFFTFGNSPRVTPSKDNVASATTTVVSPTERNVAPEALSSNPV